MTPVIVQVRGDGAKVQAFAALGKLRIFELWAGVPLAWSLLVSSDPMNSHAYVLLGLVLVMEVATVATALALDDVAGKRDGIDLANHGAARRYGVGKPLLEGRLTDREALIFAAVMGTIALAALAAALRVADDAPWWSGLLALAVMFMAVNYSVGLKLSYVGGCELVNVIATGSALVVPYLLITGTMSVVSAVEGLLIGLWMLQIVVFSNSHDAEGDRKGQRMTVAARTSDRGNRRFILAVFATGGLVTLAALALRVLPWWSALLLAPAWALYVLQLWHGVGRSQWLDARRLGFQAFRLGALALLVTNLIEGG